MQLSIFQLMIFTAVVALQIQFDQLQWVGIAIAFLVVPMFVGAVIISAFTSESKNGMLAVDDNPTYRTFSRCVFWSVANFVVVLILRIFIEAWLRR